jgi:Ser/Thr protein kinase RdoA (MazF antagonist)
MKKRQDGMADILRAAAAQFFAAGEIREVRAYGAGRVNDTFLVTGGQGESGRFLLQRLSPEVFARPDWVMENLRVVGDHVRKKMAGERGGGFELARIRQTLDGRDYYRDSGGACWRVFSFIENSRTFDTVQGPAQAAEAGRILGQFHRLLQDLDPALLHDTLPGFHVTPRYLEQYDRAAAGRGKGTADIRFCHEFIGRRRESAHILENARQRGELRLRPIHGDPKLGNILFDAQSGRAVSLIDLDTVKPGLIQYDIGDCLRSCCNTGGEEAGPEHVAFDTGLCRHILRGYLAEAASFLTPHDCRYFQAAARLIAFELGLRFFTDYLAGSIYFKTVVPEQNLHRALVQFALTESIERQEEEISAIVRELTANRQP